MHSNKRPYDSDVIKAKNLCFSDITLNENETAVFFSCLLIAASPFVMFSFSFHFDIFQQGLSTVSEYGKILIYNVPCLRPNLLNYMNELQNSFKMQYIRQRKIYKTKGEFQVKRMW